MACCGVNQTIIHFYEASILPSVCSSVHHFLQFILVLNLYCGRDLNEFLPPNSSDDLCLLFCLFLFRWSGISVCSTVLMAEWFCSCCIHRLIYTIQYICFLRNVCYTYSQQFTELEERDLAGNKNNFFKQTHFLQRRHDWGPLLSRRRYGRQR